ncbi:unnamed protein product [Cuscuta epithymum]|uniref:Uncharacterized protein n=1 Tax=Cuscuta epithymum TaxID=186058 RepID=A0AAV0C196_9ASTE|nr:unnamed protein product [Cuscuta epithymum]CAH9124615.1 unnamed protein product [Cuscuta epithymum]
MAATNCSSKKLVLRMGSFGLMLVFVLLLSHEVGIGVVEGRQLIRSKVQCKEQGCSSSQEAPPHEKSSKLNYNVSSSKLPVGGFGRPSSDVAAAGGGKKVVYTLDAFRPTSPGHSPGMGH